VNGSDDVDSPTRVVRDASIERAGTHRTADAADAADEDERGLSRDDGCRRRRES